MGFDYEIAGKLLKSPQKLSLYPLSWGIEVKYTPFPQRCPGTALIVLVQQHWPALQWGNSSCVPRKKGRDKRKSLRTKGRNLKSCGGVNIWLSEFYGNTVVEKVESNFKIADFNGVC